MHPRRALLLFAPVVCFVAPQWMVGSDEVTTLQPGLTQRSGVDAEDGIRYSRILLEGILVIPGSPGEAVALPLLSTPPTLIAQCTVQRTGKSAFELFANYGGVQDTAFHRPWHYSGNTDLFPPATEKTSITFSFYGYTKVKPIARQWESVTGVAGQWRYNNPAGSSRNMEGAAYYLQYLRALPTLRLTRKDEAAQFNVGPWMEAIRKEPLCKASGL